MSLSFEWDQRKEFANLAKHRIPFAEAATVFSDPLGVIFDDEEHSQNEVREIIIGSSARGRLLLVAFTERSENVVRIISARKATRQERKNHEEGTRQ